MVFDVRILFFLVVLGTVLSSQCRISLEKLEISNSDWDFRENLGNVTNAVLSCVKQMKPSQISFNFENLTHFRTNTHNGFKNGLLKKQTLQEILIGDVLT